ncbi:hypothetical protein [Telmatospirillum sp.]|uniref:thermonuclease family protein n=1 Tax=Telmatospirillum sp. TaxID=2079197 RepID=UPI00283D7D34|nr:hypothetical protein [Telmatospirillum sp.]MDR3436512.1 hypothetical protein [Telmatospirillum sp.]
MPFEPLPNADGYRSMSTEADGARLDSRSDGETVAAVGRWDPSLAIVAGVAACLAIGFAIALVVVVARLHAQQRPPTSDVAPSAEQGRAPPKPSSPASQAISRLVLPSFQVFELLDGDGQGFSPAIRLKTVEYPDGVTLFAEDQRLRLTGISGIGRNGVCLAANGTKFACGLQARASLSLIISGNPVVCYRDQSLPPGVQGFLCTSNGRDLAIAQVAAGFALPSRPSVQQLVEAQESARAEHKGAWSGDWSLIVLQVADSAMIP